jgi:hypothetical protein
MTSSRPQDGQADNRARFEYLGTQWDAAHSTAKIANRFYDQLRSLALEMRDSAEGRRTIESLLLHPNTGVRMFAAGTALEWTPDTAIPALEELREAHVFQSLDAKYTLIEYRKGKLKFGGWTLPE